MRKINDSLLLQMVDSGKSQKEVAEHFGVSDAAVSKRLKRLRSLELPPAVTALTEKEQKFVVARAEGKTLTQAALSSFECGSLDSARNLGSQLGKRDDIQTAISTLMEEEGIGRRHRIKALKRHIDNRHDTQASLKGIDIANKMEGIYVEKQIILTPSYADMCQNLVEIIKKKKELEQELGIEGDDAILAEYEEIREETEEQLKISDGS